MEHSNNIVTLKIKTDFSPFCGGRDIKGGDFSGEEFRDTILIKTIEYVIKHNFKLLIDLDGTSGLCPAFLEEAFGGLIRTKSYSEENLKNLITFKAKVSPYMIEDILGYWDVAEHLKGEDT